MSEKCADSTCLGVQVAALLGDQFQDRNASAVGCLSSENLELSWVPQHSTALHGTPRDPTRLEIPCGWRQHGTAWHSGDSWVARLSCRPSVKVWHLRHLSASHSSPAACSTCFSTFNGCAVLWSTWKIHRRNILRFEFILARAAEYLCYLDHFGPSMCRESKNLHESTSLGKDKRW